MELHFPWNEIGKLIEEINTATAARQLYGEDTGKGLWLVGDRGVYLMPNTTDGIHHAKLGENDRRLVVYATECNPDTMAFDDWWANKRASFGGDDSIDFIDLAELDEMVVRGSKNGDVPVALVIHFPPGQMELAIEFKAKAKSHADA
jgi:hypothetical protein